MLKIIEDESELQVHFSHYFLPVILLPIPPLLILEHSANIINGTITKGEVVGLLLGILLPLLCAYYFIEFARFTFSRREDVFSWQWRNLVKRKSGRVPLYQVVKVRREGLEASDMIGWHNSYRLVVILDDESIVALTRGYSGMHGKKLDDIVDQVRDYLGHEEPMD